jgi:GT2 family glycosyltransferase
MTDKKIAVVILNWNGVEMMRRFLPSIVSYSQEADVIVADNGSTDDSLQMLRAEFPAVRIIQLDRNYGFAEGYNKALSQIGHPYSILLNSDVEVSPGWLRPMLDYMESHPDIAACQPKIIKESERASFEYAGASGGYIDWLGYPFCRGRLMGTVEEDHGQYNQPVSIFWATGAALMVRTELYKELGGLDARFFAHQ